MWALAASYFLPVLLECQTIPADGHPSPVDKWQVTLVTASCNTVTGFGNAQAQFVGFARFVACLGSCTHTALQRANWPTKRAAEKDITARA